MENRLFRKGLAIAVVALFLGVSVIPSVVGDNPSFVNTITVDDDGDADYTRIQDAIDNASDGDTIFVYSGVYYENITIDKSIQLVGENNKTTILQKDEERIFLIRIVAESVGVKGFHLIGNRDNYGVSSKSKFNNISSNILSNLRYGILLQYKSSYNVIYNNIIENNFVGISISHSYNNDVYCNKLNNSGIDVRYCFNLSLFNKNRIFQNKLTNDGISVSNSNNVDIFHNIILDDYFGIYVLASIDIDVYGNTIDDMVKSGIKIIDSILINVFDNHISNCDYGIEFIPIYGITNNIRINRNNLIGNRINAIFSYYDFIFSFYFTLLLTPVFIINSFSIHWSRNYYDDHNGILPKIIKGELVFCSGFLDEFSIPWINIDWFPAKEPYNIPIPEVP